MQDSTQTNSQSQGSGGEGEGRGGTPLGEQTRKSKMGRNPAGFLYGLQEPPIYKGRVTNISGAGVIFAKDIPEKDVRAALVFSERLNILEQPEFTDRDMATGLLTDSRLGLVYVTSLYCHDKRPAVPPPVKKTFQGSQQGKGTTSCPSGHQQLVAIIMGREIWEYQRETMGKIS